MKCVNVTRSIVHAINKLSSNATNRLTEVHLTLRRLVHWLDGLGIRGEVRNYQDGRIHPPLLGRTMIQIPGLSNAKSLRPSS
jgi:hypothetical protein